MKFFKRFSSLTIKKKAIILGLVIAALLIIFKTVLGQNSNKPTYQTALVEKGTLVESVSVSGSVSSAGSASVNSQVSGVIDEVYVKDGDLVVEGQQIAKIVPDLDSQQKEAAAYAGYLGALSSLNSANSGKLSAQATLEKDRKTVLDAQSAVDYKNSNSINPSTKTTYTELEKQSIDSTLTSSREQFSADEKKYLDSDAAIAAASASVGSASLSNQLVSNVITSPISGIITGLSVRAGSVISSGSSLNSQATAATPSVSSQKIASVKTTAQAPLITANLGEIDVTKVKVGDKATITLDAFTDKTFTGKVTSIDTIGSVSSGVTSYPVTILLDLAEDGIYPNMSATAAIITDTKADVLLVPTAAIQTQSGQSSIRVLKNGQIETVNVEIGASNDTQTQITSGLSEGDSVVIGTDSSSGASTPSTTSPFGGSGLGGLGGGRGGGANFRRTGQ